MEKDRNWFRNFWYMRPSGLRQKTEEGVRGEGTSTLPAPALPLQAKLGYSPCQHDSRQERRHVVMENPPAFDPVSGSCCHSYPPGLVLGDRECAEVGKNHPAQFLLLGRLQHTPTSYDSPSTSLSGPPGAGVGPPPLPTGSHC